MKWSTYFADGGQFDFERAFPKSSIFSRDKLDRAYRYKTSLRSSFNVNDFLFMKEESELQMSYKLLYYSIIFTDDTEYLYNTLDNDPMKTWILDGLFAQYYPDLLNEIGEHIIQRILKAFRTKSYNSYVSRVNLGVLLYKYNYIDKAEFDLFEPLKSISPQHKDILGNLSMDAQYKNILGSL